MGMQVHAARGRGEPDVLLDINTTPLIDVMLVLLVMLIITIPIQLHAVKLNLPVGTPPPALSKPEVVRIDVNPGEQLQWNGEALAGLPELQARLQQAARQPVQPEVHLRADRRARYERFAAVIVAINQAGLSKLGVIGAEQFVD